MILKFMNLFVMSEAEKNHKDLVHLVLTFFNSIAQYFFMKTMSFLISFAELTKSFFTQTIFSSISRESQNK